MNCYQKFYTNQIHSSSLLCQLATMWKSQVLCDAIIKSGSVLIKAHRVVLVAACPMLQSMENAAVGSHLEVRLASDIKQGSINTFLQYLYEGFMMLTEENCKDVEKIARLLQVDSVIKCCADFYKCLGSKTGNSELSDQYKYTFHDMVEFRHVRSSDMQKTYQDRMMKRGPDFNRPSSPTSKRKKIYRPSSPHTISHAPDDTITMSHGYGNVSPNPWERVSWSQSSRRSNFGSTQPGVIDIVEDSLELVQTNPNLKGKKDGKPQESVSVGVASHINSSSEVQIVDIAEPKGSKTVSSSNSSGINTLSQNHMSLSSEGLAESSPLSERVSDRQPSPANQEPVDKVQSGQFSGSSHRSEIDISNSFSRSSESHMYSSPLLSLPHTRLMPSSKSFATGSASQSALPHGQRVSGSQPPPLSRGPKFTQYDSGRSENIDGVPDKKQDNSGDQIPNDAVSDKPPDLSIVKIEAVDNTGCLDMSVDTPHSVEHEDGSETEHDQSSEWIREEMSNEGSNVSTDQNSSWYLGQPQGKGHGWQTGTTQTNTSTPGAKHTRSTVTFGSDFSNKGSYGPEVVFVEENNSLLHFASADNLYMNDEFPRKDDQMGGVTIYSGDIAVDADKTLSLLSEKDFLKLESIVGELNTDPVHFIVSLKGKQKICLLCKFLGRKTNDGALSVRTRSKCQQCDIPLCKGLPRNCFRVFHEFFRLSKYPDLKWSAVQGLHTL